MATIGEAIKHVKIDKKRKLVDIPETQQENPMAPVPPKSKQRAKKNTANLSATPNPSTVPLTQTTATPGFLVPPGTEPVMPPQLGFFARGEAYGQTFGFQDFNNSRNPPNAPIDQGFNGQGRTESQAQHDYGEVGKDGWEDEGKEDDQVMEEDGDQAMEEDGDQAMEEEDGEGVASGASDEEPVESETDELYGELDILTHQYLSC